MVTIQNINMKYSDNSSYSKEQIWLNAVANIKFQTLTQVKPEHYKSNS